MRVSASAAMSCATTTSTGTFTRPVSSSALQSCDPLGLEQRVADLVALRGEEREGHRATDEDRLALVEQRVDHAELVADLRAAEDGDERLLRRRRAAPRAPRPRGTSSRPPALGQDRRAARRSTRAPGATRRTPRSRRRRPSRERRPRAPGCCRSRPVRTAGSRASSRRPRSRLAAIDGGGRPDHLRAPARPHGRAARRAASRPGPSRTAGRACPSGGRGGRTRRPRRPGRAATASSAARCAMRRSSSTRPSRSGTLKSARSRTRQPCSLGRSSRRGRSMLMATCWCVVRWFSWRR